MCEVPDGTTPRVTKRAGTCSDSPRYFGVVNAGGDLPYHLMLASDCSPYKRVPCSVDAMCSDGTTIAVRTSGNGGSIEIKTPTCSGVYDVSF